MPNTTPLNGDPTSGIGRDQAVTSQLGKQIQGAVSRANLESRVKTNESIKGLYENVQKMVSRWSIEDKMNVIRAYGNTENLKKNSSEADINNETTLTLISNIDKDELKKIVQSEAAKSGQLVSTVYKINSKTLANAKKRSINRKNFDEITGGGDTKYATNDKQLLKSIKRNDKSFKIPRALAKKYPTLRKELTQILGGYVNYELGQTALRMGIDFPEHISAKELTTQIINKCILYVSMIIGTGKNDGVSAGAISQDESDEISKLLEMTSFSWVTGKAGLTNADIVAKRKKAMNAKRVMQAQEKMAQMNRNKTSHSGKVKTHKNGTLKIKGKFGLIRSAVYWKNIKALAQTLEDNKVLDNLNEDQIKALAIKKGLPVEDFGVDELKKQLFQIMATEEYELRKKNKRLEKLQSNASWFDQMGQSGTILGRAARRKYNAAKADKQELDKATTLSMADKLTSPNPFATGGETSEKVPVVSFNENGNLVSKAVAQAVPVFVVGQADIRGKIAQLDQNGHQLSETQIDQLESDADSSSMSNSVRAALDYQLKNKDASGAGAKIQAGALQHKADEDKIGKVIPSMTGNGVGGGSAADAYVTQSKFNLSPEAQAIQDANKAAYANAISGAYQLPDKSKDVDLQNLQDQAEEDHKNSKKVSNISLVKLKDSIASMPYKLFIKKGIKYNNIVPVIDINKSHDYAGYLKTISDELGAIGNFTSTFYTAFAGLQSAGVSVNAAAPAAAAAQILQTVQGASSLAAQSLTKTATGGQMKAKTSVSSIVTGDSPLGKNNTEVVSVDWANKKLNVKPVPKMATGGTAQADNSGVTNVQRYTAGQRNTPLQVGLSTGLVKYSKSLSDVEDDSSGTAVKVYSINTGINEKIKIGETEASLFDIVYGVYTTLSTVAQGITTSNQLLTAISASTAGTEKYAKQLTSKSGNSNSGLDFPSNLDAILAGK